MNPARGNPARAGLLLIGHGTASSLPQYRPPLLHAVGPRLAAGLFGSLRLRRRSSVSWRSFGESACGFLIASDS